MFDCVSLRGCFTAVGTAPREFQHVAFDYETCLACQALSQTFYVIAREIDNASATGTHHVVVVFRRSSKQICWLTPVHRYLADHVEIDEDMEGAVDGHESDISRLSLCGGVQLRRREVTRTRGERTNYRATLGSQLVAPGPQLVQYSRLEIRCLHWR